MVTPTSGWHAHPLVNPLSIRPERLERLRKICLTLPEATEKEAWGDPTWRVRDRIFAMQKGNFEGGCPSLWPKAADDAQALLVEADPRRFFVPPYVGTRAGGATRRLPPGPTQPQGRPRSPASRRATRAPLGTTLKSDLQPHAVIHQESIDGAGIGGGVSATPPYQRND